uniref:CSON009527 protein n=1 Tax=Culicoides sonorensis TaxID=179676 RepID=A0A336LK56_CULSO
MASFKFFYDLMSPPSRALFIFFNKLQIRYEPVKIALRHSEQLTDDYRNNVHRLQKLPVIHHNNFKLSESVAILMYLKRESIIPETLLFPSDNRALARIDEYLEWTHNNIRMSGGMLFMLKWAMPFITQEIPPEKNVKQYEKMFKTNLDTFEYIWLESENFVTGNQITYADILAACDIEQTRIAGYNPTQDRPRLSDWLDKVKAETNPFFEEGHKYIYKYAEQYKGVPPIKSSL